MIRYALKCSNEHSFESWFQSAKAYEGLAAKGLVCCAVCGDAAITKAIMAPGVATSDEPASLRAPASKAERALTALKEKIEREADYVGTSFATEARAIKDGDAPDRPIWGEANLPEAKALIKDGVAVAPLPFTPSRKAN